jgi:hypothetical protein
MYKAIFILIIFVTSIFAAPPPPWAKDGAQKDTVTTQKKPLPPPFDKADAQKRDTIFIIVSSEVSDTKEYTIADPADLRNNGPTMKIIQMGAIINITLASKFAGSSGSLRDINDNKLIWNGKVPKNLLIEINTSDWKPGKYYGGIFNYKFGVIKE